MNNPLTRADYVRMNLAELTRRLSAVRDRMARAENMEAALADAFAEQELCAAIIMSGGQP